MARLKKLRGALGASLGQVGSFYITLKVSNTPAFSTAELTDYVWHYLARLKRWAHAYELCNHQALVVV